VARSSKAREKSVWRLRVPWNLSFSPIGRSSKQSSELSSERWLEERAVTEQKGIKFILVEDGAEEAKLFQILMEEIAPHVEVIVLRNANELLDFISRHPGGPDSPILFFLDINLPGKTGLEVLPEVKAHPKWKVSPVIVFTTSSAAADIRCAYARFASGFVRKPNDIGDFRKVLKDLIAFWLSGAVHIPGGMHGPTTYP
jgi:CheY-like chemotaxis protein